jgi:hypothetical protein
MSPGEAVVVTNVPPERRVSHIRDGGRDTRITVYGVWPMTTDRAAPTDDLRAGPTETGLWAAVPGVPDDRRSDHGD